MKPHAILKKYFDRKKKANSQYSMRAAARSLDVDAAFLSRVLSGKKSIPLEKVDQWAEVLELDSLALKELKKSLAADMLKILGLTPQDFSGRRGTTQVKSTVLEFDDQLTQTKELGILNPWYNLFVLDLLTTKEIRADAGLIASRLDISEQEVSESLSYLKKHGYVREVDGTIGKTDAKIRWPTKLSAPLVRQFHKSILERAVREMNRNTDAESFAKRLITSASVAVNPSKIPEAKELLQRTQLEVAEILSQGDCTEVYDLSLLLFPISRSR